MANEKEDAKAKRCDKLLFALEKLQNKGIVGSFVKVYAAKSEQNVVVSIDNNGNLVLSIKREFFESLNIPGHIMNNEEKKDLREVEKLYKSAKSFLQKMKWNYDEKSDYIDMNVHSLSGTKTKKLMRSFSFDVSFGRHAGAVAFVIDDIFLKLFKLPKNYDVTPSLTIVEKPIS
mgnify:CR=1 FL=1